MASSKPKKPSSQKPKKPKVSPSSVSPRRIKPKSEVAGSMHIFGRSLKLIKQHWKLFTAITFIYAVLTVIFVRGFSNGVNLNAIKSPLKKAGGANAGKFAIGMTLFGYILSDATNPSSNGSSDINGVYQTVLIIVMSLVIIWTLRELLAGKKVRAKQAFYNGMYPLIPFVLVLIVIGVQLLPFVIGYKLYTTVITNGIAVGGLEKIFWNGLLALLTFWSLYMVSSSIFALYIVTLPDMKPFKALRSAKQLVRRRRFMVIRKVLFLPFILVVAATIITVPLSYYLTSLASWIFVVLSLLTLIVVHTYMYTLYRELL